MKTLTKIAIISVAAIPLLASAQITCPGLSGQGTICGILVTIDGILRAVVPILMVLATVVFLWGVVRYVTAGGDEDKLKEGRQFIIFGLIGLFVMVAVWGIVAALVRSFGVGGGIPSGPGGSLF